MFERLFYSNGFPLRCNVLIRFCCTMVLLMTTGQIIVHYQTNVVISVSFVPLGVSPGKKNNNINERCVYRHIQIQSHRVDRLYGIHTRNMSGKPESISTGRTL